MRRIIDVNKIKEPIPELHEKDKLVYTDDVNTPLDGRVRKIREHVESPKERWEKLVNEGKSCVMTRHQCRVTLCTLAQEACTITHGGGLKSYTDAIGMPYKTLHGWMQTKRDMYDKINKIYRDEFNWSCAALALRKIYAFVRDNPGVDVSNARLTEAYEAELAINADPLQRRQQKVHSYLQSLQSNIGKMGTAEELRGMRHDIEKVLRQIDMRLILKTRGAKC